MKKLLLILILCLFLIPMASSADDYVKGQNMDIVEEVLLDGFPSASVLVNITVKNPNNTILVAFQEMTYNSGSQTYNYTVPASNVSVVGDYCYTMFATNGTLSDSISKCVEVTNTGESLSSAQGLIYGILILMATVIFFLTLYGGVKIPWSDRVNTEGHLLTVSGKKYLKPILLFLSWLTLLFIFSVSNDISQSYLFLQSAAGLFRILYLAMLSATVPLFFGMVLFLFIRVFSDKKIMKQIERGIPIRR